MMALARRLKSQLRAFTTFTRDGLTGWECAGRTLLIVGVGRIGTQIATMARGFGMHVTGVDLVKRVDWLDYVELGLGLRDADAVICALPLTDRTRGLLDYARLRDAKRGVVFVNVARGGDLTVARCTTIAG